MVYTTWHLQLTEIDLRTHKVTRRRGRRQRAWAPSGHGAHSTVLKLAENVPGWHGRCWPLLQYAPGSHRDRFVWVNFVPPVGYLRDPGAPTRIHELRGYRRPLTSQAPPESGTPSPQGRKANFRRMAKERWSPRKNIPVDMIPERWH